MNGHASYKSEAAVERNLASRVIVIVRAETELRFWSMER